MAGDVKVSIKPLSDARWETHEPTGAKYLIAPLMPEQDQQFTRECKRPDGDVDALAFAHKVAQHCIKDWRHVGEGSVAVPCNEANRGTFATHHAFSTMPWVIWKARSISHYVATEIEAAKKD